MSAPIRSQLALITSRLTGYLDNIPDIQLQLTDTMSNSAREKHIDDTDLSVIHEITGIKGLIEQLENLNLRWQQYILSLPEDAQEAEETLYSQTAIAKSNFFQEMQRGHEAIGVLEMKRLNLNYIKNRLQLSNVDITKAPALNAPTTMQLPKFQLPSFKERY
uniref:Uncharacterized protein n=1 Tax=Ditylenchus dipsaci TaxID=166011 RepID=A0A915CW21_9BILA